MKGLILKDFYALRKQGKILFILLIFYLVYSVLYKNVTMLGSMTALLCSMLPLTTFSLDERCNWEKFALSMPLKRRTVVFGKYLFGIIINGLSTVLLILLGTFVVTYTKEMSMGKMLLTILAIAGVTIVLLAVILPIFFKFGAERGRFVLILTVFIPVMGSYFISKLHLKMPDRQVIRGLEYLSPLFVLAILAISVLISVKIYEKKEF